MFRKRQSVLFFVLATGGTDRRTVSSTTSGTAERNLRNASRSCAGRERRVHSGYTVQSDSASVVRETSAVAVVRRLSCEYAACLWWLVVFCVVSRFLGLRSH